MPPLRVAFTDMYAGYWDELHSNPLLNYFATRHTLVMPHDNPDLIVSSIFAKQHTQYPEIPTLVWSGENLDHGQWKESYSFDHVDWAILTNDPEQLNLFPDVKSYHVPYVALHYDIDTIRQLHERNRTKPKTKFCCFVSSAGGSPTGYALRDDFFQTLSRCYQPVDSAGKIMNNIGYRAPRDKQAFIDWVSDYKFMISFENSKGPGYLTEKIFTPYAAATVPIYWGDEGNFDYVRRQAAIVHSTKPQTLCQVIAADQDDDLYRHYQNQELIIPEREERLRTSRLLTILDSICQEIKK